MHVCGLRSSTLSFCTCVRVCVPFSHWEALRLPLLYHEVDHTLVRWLLLCGRVCLGDRGIGGGMVGVGVDTVAVHRIAVGVAVDDCI